MHRNRRSWDSAHFAISTLMRALFHERLSVLSQFKSTKDPLDMLLTEVGSAQLLCCAIEAVGYQGGSPLSLRHQSFRSLRWILTNVSGFGARGLQSF